MLQRGNNPSLLNVLYRFYLILLWHDIQNITLGEVLSPLLTDCVHQERMV
ncbi:hypothetical protein GPAL_1647 [Glaciecola pallidula DSM 14239 = ACAM 615]|uniref:Uncharacterized protein n=1 Tax=Brumicola pallidula DSM 14239 = ACAM 615 TaxID=1121922 RepID=K6YX07_9ALTE|nr:hypothetical protein GPAL_1647 [Glaciecola pallidula DSM 14239 = ACAM 615]